jgi:hypothetical protein
MKYATGLLSIVVAFVVLNATNLTYVDSTEDGAEGYVGEATCLSCHTGLTPEIVNNYMLSGHRYKLNPVEDGTPRAYPTSRETRAGESPAEVAPPAGTAWTDFAYVIGGYGWKARFVRTTGRVYTDDAEAQQNLYATEANGGAERVTYHLGEDKKYNYGCFKCHTTGGTEEGSWNGVDADSLGTFSDPGVTCEGCHGPGQEHAAGAFTGVLPPNTGDFLRTERCIDCHQRDGRTSAIPVKGNYIRHHEQGNEFRASAHGDGVGSELTCASCHNQHVPLRYPELATNGETGLNATCADCHASQYPMPTVNGVSKSIECVDCHMSRASKSALGFTLGNGVMGDVASHLMKINTDPVGREAMFTEDGKLVKLDDEGHGAVTMDFACLGCHTDKDVGWAAQFAEALHTTGVVTSTDDRADVPRKFELGQNYPNPFNPSTTIHFALPEASTVSLELYSVDGRLVHSVLNRRMPAGNHQITMDAGHLPSGIYIYRLSTDGFSEARTMTLLR